MRTRSNGAVRPGAAAVVALAVAAAAAVTGAAGAKPKTDPRAYDLKRGKAKILGNTVSQWTAEWWQWAYSIPASVNPILDTTGAFVEVGQFGPVWFLGGTFTGAGPTRTATIPTGRSLLFPIFNAQWDAFDPSATTVEIMRTKAAEQVGALDPSKLTCIVDGVPLAGLDRNQVKSPVFEYHIPEDNTYQALGYDYLGQPIHRGVVNPAVSDGYWVFLRPLPAGPHQIEFSSGGATVTYVLTVVDHDRP